MSDSEEDTTVKIKDADKESDTDSDADTESDESEVSDLDMEKVSDDENETDTINDIVSDGEDFGGDGSDTEVKETKKKSTKKPIKKIAKKYKNRNKVITREEFPLNNMDNASFRLIGIDVLRTKILKAINDSKSDLKSEQHIKQIEKTIFNDALTKKREGLVDSTREEYAKVIFENVCSNKIIVGSIFESEEFKTEKEESYTITRLREYPPEIHDSDVSCRFCKHKKVFYFLMQTRSSDEPMTIFYFCMKDPTKHKWTV